MRFFSLLSALTSCASLSFGFPICKVDILSSGREMRFVFYDRVGPVADSYANGKTMQSRSLG